MKFIAMPVKSLNKYHTIDPRLLNGNSLLKPLRVFLCGPGFEHSRYKIREDIKAHLCSFENVEVIYGEDLEKPKYRKELQKGKHDLQTLEMDFAHLADFTVLMLESPGSIAELGTFSMIEALRQRIFVVTPAEFYKSESYIARGPLSILSRISSINVSYFHDGETSSLHHNLNWAVMIYKIMRSQFSEDYLSHLTLEKKNKEYFGYTQKKIENIKASIGLSVINMLEKPTYSELVSNLMMAPRDVNLLLRVLFDKECVRKDRQNRYYPTQPFSDNLLSSFDSGRLSRRKAELIAT